MQIRSLDQVFQYLLPITPTCATSATLMTVAFARTSRLRQTQTDTRTGLRARTRRISFEIHRKYLYGFVTFRSRALLLLTLTSPTRERERKTCQTTELPGPAPSVCGPAHTHNTPRTPDSSPKLSLNRTFATSTDLTSTKQSLRRHPNPNCIEEQPLNFTSNNAHSIIAHHFNHDSFRTPNFLEPSQVAFRATISN